eukprot:351589-Alexandrium_andersonii.AAC.1
MSASLVGSEMCIRDSRGSLHPHGARKGGVRGKGDLSEGGSRRPRTRGWREWCQTARARRAER